jgi:hypothetical protein
MMKKVKPGFETLWTTFIRLWSALVVVLPSECWGKHLGFTTTTLLQEIIRNCWWRVFVNHLFFVLEDEEFFAWGEISITSLLQNWTPPPPSIPRYTSVACAVGPNVTLSSTDFSF